MAPFSQNSKELVCLGSGQAHPGQSKPSGWFIDSSASGAFQHNALLAKRLRNGVERAPAAGRALIRLEDRACLRLMNLDAWLAGRRRLRLV